MPPLSALTSEPASGRDKTTKSPSNRCDRKAGGDYYNTITRSRPMFRRAKFAARGNHCLFRFRFPPRRFSRNRNMALPERLEIFLPASTICGSGRPDVEPFRSPAATARVGLWRAILGLKDGENSFTRMQTMRDAGVKVSGLWCEDWLACATPLSAPACFWILASQ